MKKVQEKSFSISDRITSAVFDNGLRSFIMKKSDAPVVTVQAWVETGSAHEGRFMGCGLSHFLEHMLFQGTAKYPESAVSDTVSRLGGDINAYTSKGVTVYYITLPAKDCATAIDLIDDMLRNPSFPQHKFDSEKEVIMRELAMLLDSPDRMLTEHLMREVFQTHPFRHPIIGYKEKLETVTRDMMAQYFHLRYTPARTFYVIVGDVDPEKTIETLRKKCASWPMGRIDDESAVMPQEKPQLAPRKATHKFHDPLTRIGVGWQIPEISHPDTPAIDVFMTIFGANASSRLFKTLKTDLELAISCSSYAYTTNLAGLGGYFAACEPAKAAELVAKATGIIEELRRSEVSDAEFERCITQQKVDYIRGMRSNTGLARIIGWTALNYGTPDSADKYLEMLCAVTKKDILRVAQTYFTPDRMSVVEIIPDTPVKTKAKKKGKSEERALPTLSKLPSGQKFIHLGNSNLPLVDVSISLPGGPFFESGKLFEASKLLAACLVTGNSKYDEDAFTELLDDHALEMTVSSSQESLNIRLNFPKEKLELASDALKSMMASPLFAEKAFQREKANIISSLKSQLTVPNVLAVNSFCTMLYGKKHPAGRDIAEMIKELEKLSAADMKKFYRDVCLTPSMAHIGIAGDISRGNAELLASDIFSACDWNSNPSLKYPAEPLFPSKPVRSEIKLKKEQCVIISGVPAVDIRSDDTLHVAILQEATNNMSSRLFKTVRDDNGLAYYAGMSIVTGIHRGHIAYYAGTRPDALAEVEKAFEAERMRVIKEGLTKEEFESAKASIRNDHYTLLQNPGKLIAIAVDSEMYGKGFMAPWQKEERMAAITLDDLNSTLAKYLDTSSIVTAIVTP